MKQWWPSVLTTSRYSSVTPGKTLVPDYRIISARLAEFANQNRLLPGEILVIWMDEDFPGFHLFVMYYAEQEIKAV